MADAAIETRVIDGKTITGTPDNFACHEVMAKLFAARDALDEVRVLQRDGRVDDGYRVLLGDNLRLLAKETDELRKLVAEG